VSQQTLFAPPTDAEILALMPPCRSLRHPNTLGFCAGDPKRGFPAFGQARTWNALRGQWTELVTVWTPDEATARRMIVGALRAADVRALLPSPPWTEDQP